MSAGRPGDAADGPRSGPGAEPRAEAPRSATARPTTVPGTSPRAGATSFDAAVLGGLFFAALSLRPQLVGVAPLLADIQSELGLSHAAAGLLATIPVLCMGVFAPIAPLVAVRLGTVRAVTLAVALIAGAGLVRAVTSTEAELLLLTVGIGIGMGIAGALLPVVVRERLPAAPIAGSVSYSAGLQLGSAASAALAVPIALALGGWRGSLLVLSASTLVALVVWLLLVARRPTSTPRMSLSRLDFADRRGWLLAAIFGLFGVVYYGLISWLADAYIEIGWPAAGAGGLVGLLNVASLAGAVTIGPVVGRLVGYRTAVVSLALGFAAGTAGFVVAPGAGAAWALVAGYSNGALFPLIMAMPLRLTGSRDRVAGLASVMLGGGYTVAALSPIALGALRDASGSFHASLVALVVVGAVFVAGVAAIASLPTAAMGATGATNR